MYELIAKLQSYARATWRYRWYAQLVTWPLCLAGWVFVYLMPNQYEATARIYIDTQSMLRPLLQGLVVQTNVNEQIQALMRTLLSRPNLEKVARMSDLDLQAKTPEDMELLLNRLAKKIVLNTAGRENLFSVSYTYDQPEIAKQVVQAVVTVFVESSLGDTRKDSNAAQQFLDEQIKEYEAKLFTAEDRLKQFKQQNVNVMPSEGRGYYERLQVEVATLERSKLELHELEKRRDELKRQLDGEEPSFGLVQQNQTVDSISPFKMRIHALESRLDELVVRFTDEHPDVVSLRKQIDELREQEKKSGDSQATRSGKNVSRVESNPVYQQLKLSLGDTEAQIAGLRVRVKEYEDRVSHYNKLVDTVPQVEAELSRLNRDYSVNKQNYETLIARRESAKISEQAAQSSDELKYKIVDPPRVPLAPVGPNRRQLASIVLIGSIVMGLAFALFLSEIKPTFDHHRAVTEATNTPVFGYVTMIWTDAARTKYRIEVISYAAVTIVLFIIYGFYITMHGLTTTLVK